MNIFFLHHIHLQLLTELALILQKLFQTTFSVEIRL